MTMGSKGKRGHPKGLYLLFTVEMWERFSYYGMRALLVLYMVKHLHYSTEQAGSVYAWYTGLVYLTPVLGGYIADNYIGKRMAITIGGALMALGHFAMAFESLLYPALGLLILGNGFFKPNITTTVKELYEPNDSRLDSAMTIFYMGINLGAFFSPLVCGTLGEKIGWHYGFAAAGVGMVIGLAVYLKLGNRLLGSAGLKPAPLAAGHKHEPLTSTDWQRISVIFAMMIFVVAFWMAFEQAGSSMTLFADRETNRMLPFVGYVFPASWYQSVNPFLIFLLAPLFSGMWVRLAGMGRDPRTPKKMAIGLLLLAVGFGFMVVAAGLFQQFGPVSFLWLFGAYFFHTLGELCLSPVGLSLVNKLSPARFAGLLMGVWFTSNFIANFIGGKLAGSYDAISHTRFYGFLTVEGLLAAVLLFALSPWLEKRMHGVH